MVIQGLDISWEKTLARAIGSWWLRMKSRENVYQLGIISWMMYKKWTVTGEGVVGRKLPGKFEQAVKWKIDRFGKIQLGKTSVHSTTLCFFCRM